MREIKDAGQKPPKKPLIFYYLIALLVLFLLNALVFPSLMSPKVVEVPYNEFLNMIDEGQVKQVALEESSGQLVFLADVSDEGAETAADSGQYGIFKTGIWPDDGQRLLEQLRSDPDIQFTAEIPTQSNPLLSFIMTWILPVFFFILIGELLSRWMMKRMNKQMGGGFGNAMSFGKSGAKVYVEETETGVTFADVAGQEEAKESLKELVDFLHEPEKRFWPRQWPGKPRFRFSPYPDRNSWKCLSVWAPPRCAICLNRPMKKHRVSCSSMRLMPSAKSVMPEV